MQQTMQKANERAMQMAENQMVQMKEAMVAITQRQGAPMMKQPVLPPPTSRQQYIAPPVKPILCEQVDDMGQICRIHFNAFIFKGVTVLHWHNFFTRRVFFIFRGRVRVVSESLLIVLGDLVRY